MAHNNGKLDETSLEEKYCTNHQNECRNSKGERNWELFWPNLLSQSFARLGKSTTPRLLL